MQLFALENNAPIIASHAKKQTPYHCPECNGIVHLRGGPHKQFHFYHLTINPLCRQHQKSLEHVHAQLHLLNLLPPGEMSMERSFPEINRIGDCVWETQKIVFEIQCSAISKEEVQSRSTDYASMGWKIVWILHDKRFNQILVGGAEDFLTHRPCYFTNISRIGEGIIYDQFQIISRHKRLFKGPPLPVFLHKPHVFKSTDSYAAKSRIILSRIEHNEQKQIFQGDLLDRFIRDPKKKEIDTRFCSIENSYLTPKTRVTPSILKILKRIYQIILTYAIKRTTTEVV